MAAAAAFLAFSILIVSPYGIGVIASGRFSFGLFGSAGTCAKTPELQQRGAEDAREHSQTTHRSSSQLIDFPVNPVGLLPCIAGRRTVPQISLSNRRAFAYMGYKRE